jgi:acyl-CoA dehydrogenase
MSARSLLADVVEEIFAKHSTPEYVASAESAGEAPELWARVEELGLTLASVPEELGGSGAAPTDEIEILLAAARHAAPIPIVETSFLAGWLLAGAGIAARAGLMTAAPLRPDEHFLIRSDADGWTLDGAATRVPSASLAERIVVLAVDDRGETHVATVPASAAKLAPARTIAGEWRDSVTFHGARLPAAAVAPAPVDVAQLRRRAALGWSIMTLGALEAVRDMCVRHVLERSQFGRPIARFQAVQHHVAAIAREVALTRAAVATATASLDEQRDLALLETASAKVVSARAATRVGAAAHQLHGAIGITREHSLQLFTRRLWAWRDDGGADVEWARSLGEDLLSARTGVWAAVAPVSVAQERSLHA